MKQSPDKLSINELLVPCIIGVFENERKEKQNVSISLELSVDTHKAGQTDNISDTVSYHDIANDVYRLVSESHFQLLEKLAQTVADFCLKDKRIQQVVVHIQKPQALKHAKSAAITITRTNEQ